MEKDLFEEVAATLGCDYISDIKTEAYNARAKRMLANVDYKKYPLRVLNDIYEYVYGGKADFSDYDEAEKAFELQK